jgi:hypothetical protein
MVGDGGMSPTPPAVGSTPPAAPGVANSRRGPGKKLIAAVVAVLLIGGIAGWYFGYYMNPSVIYSQSLKNTGKGYDKLVDYIDKQEKSTEQNYTGNGTFKAKFGEFSTDGTVALKSGSGNGELTFDVGLAATRLKADIRTLKSSSETPDIYVKVADVKGLGTVIGTPELDASLAKIDNTWIAIDHTLIDNLSSIATAQAEADAASKQGPTREQVFDEARAFGKVNQEYLLSTDKNKAVTKIVKKVGAETVDGHKTYHYKVALQPDNVKKYIYAQRDALKASKLNGWLKDNKYDKDVYDSFDEAAKSTKDIKTSDTYDIWMDSGKRVVYKLRFSDPESKSAAQNYVDVGLDYKGGDKYPFFIAGSFKSEGEEAAATFRLVTALDTKSGTTSLAFDLKAPGSNGGTASANFTFKPSSTPVKVEKPSGAKPLSQLLSELGYGDILSQLQSSPGNGVYAGQQDKARDSKRKSDIATIQTQLEAFFQNDGYYPSLADMNSSAWLASNMKSLDKTALADPDSSNSQKLAGAPAVHVYAYQPTDSAGKSCESDDTNCAKYTLTATLSDGSVYSKSNLD